MEQKIHSDLVDVPDVIEHLPALTGPAYLNVEWVEHRLTYDSETDSFVSAEDETAPVVDDKLIGRAEWRVEGRENSYPSRDLAEAVARIGGRRETPER